MDKNLGARLRSLRTKRNLLQKQVAAELGISESGYGFYEQGKRMPDGETIKKLASLFGVSADYILGVTPRHLTSEHLDNTYTKIKETFGEEAEVMFRDISTFDQEDFEKLQMLVNMVKNQKK